MKQRKRVSGIYAVTPESEDTADLVAKVSAVLSGGARVIQYRNKDGEYALRREQCTELCARVRAFDGILIVNDSVELALETGADGIHLGRDDELVKNARSRLGPDKTIGVSCYNDLELAHAAQAAGADYVAFGSFFLSATKPAAKRASMSVLHSAKAELDVPVVAIGGINMDNAAYVQLFASPRHVQ
jgi:thiamine-phosphate pyrophosphorylase